MFYQGDLQSGINKALQQSKYVACFVTDGGEESRIWEEDYLADPSIKSFLSSDAVLLRLVAGSQEAGYLAAIFPLPKSPTFVIVQNGQLKEYLTSGCLKDDFLRRIRTVLNSDGASTSIEEEAPTGAETSRSTSSVGVNNSSSVAPDTYQVTQARTASTVPTIPTAESSMQVVQDLFAERSARLDAHKKEQEAKEKAKHLAEAKAQKTALVEALVESTGSADKKYALMQRKRQQEALEERARILKRVEDDRAERRDRELQRKAQNKAIYNTESSDSVTATSSIVPSASGHTQECALQIRLFDGSTIRSRFSSHGSLNADVRPWINEQQSTDTPYTFKHVLMPLPNKNISISDEGRSLQSQGLTPSATLILVPINEYSSAYNSSGATGYVSRGSSAGYGLVSSGVGLVTGILGSILRGGAAQASPPAANTPIQPTSYSNISGRTPREQDRAEDQQFYNGNALNFEPRKDDEDKKKE